MRMAFTHIPGTRLGGGGELAMPSTFSRSHLVSCVLSLGGGLEIFA